MSHATFFPPVRQVGQRCRQLLSQEGLPFAQHLPESMIHDAVRQAGGRFRERVFTPAVTLWTFLSQVFDADHSCRKAVAHLVAWLVAQGRRACSADTGAYCKARQRFPEAGLARLVRDSGRKLHDQAEHGWLWRGRRAKVVDGSGLSLADTEENQKEYPKHRHLPPGVGFPMMRIVVIFSLAVGTVLDAAMGRFRGKLTGELSLFRTLDDALEPGDVLVGDRLFADFWDVARLFQRGIDIVMRLHAGRHEIPFVGRGHSKANRKIWWQKGQRPRWLAQADYDALPQWLRLRALRVEVRQRGFRTKQLDVVTTLTDAQAYPAADIAELYRRRWQAELNFRSLKSEMQMDILRGKTPDVARKEVWAHLLAYNLVRGLMAQAAAAEGVRPDEISFKGALQTFDAFLPYLLLAHTAAEAATRWTAMVAAIGEHRVGNRPDRYEPRAVKRRPKRYPMLSVTRKEAHRRLRDGETFDRPKS